MKYILVGDVHGKVDAVEDALARDGHKIFVGDFIDSFDRSLEDHKKCYDLVFEAIDNKEATCIFGNHELSYYVERQKCSGWDYQRNTLMQSIKKDIQSRFKNYVLLPDTNILITHAGLTRQLWNDYEITLKNLDMTLTHWTHSYNSPLYQIGRYRGGYDQYGGPFWCDFSGEFIDVPELMQVFGHTIGNGIRKVGNSFCIDCLDQKPYEFLELEV